MTIILYHDPPAALFKQHVLALRKRYSIITLRRFVEAKTRGELDTLPNRSLIITVDDGHRGNYPLLPLLRDLDLPITIFLCAALVGTNRRFWFKGVDRPKEYKRLPDTERLARLAAGGFSETSDSGREALSIEEIEEMKSLVDFQSHTLSHPILPYCRADKAWAEIAESKELLERLLGSDVYALSYPNGDYSDREIESARAAGYACAITVDHGFNDNKTDPFTLKRISIGDDAGVSEAIVKTSGVWGWIRGFLKPQAWGHTSATEAGVEAVTS